jgi:hypothetical protein
MEHGKPALVKEGPAKGATILEPLDAMYTYMSPEGPKPVNTTGCFGTVSTFGGLNHLSIITKGKSGRRRDKVKKHGGKKYDPDWSALVSRRRDMHLRIIRGQAGAWEIQRFLELTEKVKAADPHLYAKMIRADLAREASLYGEM